MEYLFGIPIIIFIVVYSIDVYRIFSEINAYNKRKKNLSAINWIRYELEAIKRDKKD